MEMAQEGHSTPVGECHGGPLNGMKGSSRFPKGFLLVDKQANLAWIYDWNGTAFLCREAEGRTVDYERRWETAESVDWDVQAFAGGDAK